MDSTSLVLNISSVTFSAIALLMSTFLASRQVRLMRHANQLPVFVELLRELRTSEFQAQREYVWRNMADHDPALGLSNLPEPARTNIRMVSLFYQNIAFLMLYGILDHELVYKTLYYGIDRTWTTIGPFVHGERELRGDELFCRSFEEMASGFRQERLRQPPTGSWSSKRRSRWPRR